MPWAIFRQQTAAGGHDQTFVRSFAEGEWSTRGSGTVGGRSSASPVFGGSLNFDQGQDGEAPADRLRRSRSHRSLGELVREHDGSGIRQQQCVRQPLRQRRRRQSGQMDLLGAESWHRRRQRPGPVAEHPHRRERREPVGGRRLDGRRDEAEPVGRMAGDLHDTGGDPTRSSSSAPRARGSRTATA